MLDPEYLRRITEGSEQIAEELHQYIISEIVSRMMARIGRGEDYILTNADAWRIRTLQESGELLEDILAELSRYTKREQQELLEAFEDAGITAMNYDDKVYKAAGLNPVPLEQSPTMIRLEMCLLPWASRRTSQEQPQVLLRGSISSNATLHTIT